LENTSTDPVNFTNLASKFILPALIFLGAAFLLFYTWTIQQSCQPLMGDKPDHCFIQDISIDYRRLPWDTGDSLSLKIDEEKQLSTKVNVEKADHPINQEVIWISSQPNVVQVDQQGKITAISPGKADIQVRSTLSQKKAATIEVTVTVGEEPWLRL